MASFPTSVKTWTDRTDNIDDVMAADVNDAYAEIIAVETNLLSELDISRISGCKISYTSTTSITIGTGKCYAANGDFINITSAIVKSSLSLAASTFYHIYVYLSGGVAAAEVVTTAPAAAYLGTARGKTGDTTRRYIGSILSNGVGSVISFLHIPKSDTILYTTIQDQAPFRVLANGNATAETNVSCAGAIPVTAVALNVKFSNIDATYVAAFGNSIDTVTLGTTSAIVIIDAKKSAFIPNYPLDNSQQFSYLVASGGSGVYADVYGYTFER